LRRNLGGGEGGATTPERGETLTPAPRILIPRAEGARAELIEGLTALGAEVDEVPLYRAALPAEAPPEALDLLRNGEIDIVTFTSSSTVRNLVEILGNDSSVILSGTPAGAQDDAPSRRDLEVGGTGTIPERGEPTPEPSAPLGTQHSALSTQRPLIACIGPITAQTARELGLPVDIEATEHTVEGLVAALKERLSTHA
jgi:uroporphyrinogen-III synthase